jgi:hypothetical protein
LHGVSGFVAAPATALDLGDGLLNSLLCVGVKYIKKTPTTIKGSGYSNTRLLITELLFKPSNLILQMAFAYRPSTLSFYLFYPTQAQQKSAASSQVIILA